MPVSACTAAIMLVKVFVDSALIVSSERAQRMRLQEPSGLSVRPPA